MNAAFVLVASIAAADPAATTTAAKTERAQLLILELDAIEVDPAKVGILNGRIASLISERSDVEALTASDIKAMATIDASKSAMGCEESSCLAEIANAMGAKYVVYGRVGKLDDVILLQLNLFDASVGKAISRQESQGSRLADLAEKMPTVVNALLRPLGGSPAPASAIVEAPAGTPLSPLFLTGVGVAGVGAVVGVGFGVWAMAMNGDLESADASIEQKQFAFDNGIWVASTAIGGAVLAAAGLGVLGVSMMQ